jgi:hypothetical protein
LLEFETTAGGYENFETGICGTSKQFTISLAQPILPAEP